MTLVNIYSEPFSDASQLATYLICKEIRSSGIKVAISGDGGDELFGGYNRHIYGSLIHKRFGSLIRFRSTVLLKNQHFPIC